MTAAWDGAHAYERYVGRWSRCVAREFIGWVGVPAGAGWLDVGCGTGALSEEIASLSAPSRVEGIDPSSAFVAEAERRLTSPVFSFHVGDALSLPHPDSTFDAVASALVLTFLSDPALGVREMARVAKPGSIVASYVWDYSGEMQMMKCFWEVASELDHRAGAIDERLRFALAHPDELELLFGGAGLTGVVSTPLEIRTRFASFDDYWEPFLGGQGSAPGYVASLSEDQRTRLRDALKERVPVEEDGSVDLLARAWGVKGTAG